MNHFIFKFKNCLCVCNILICMIGLICILASKVFAVTNAGSTCVNIVFDDSAIISNGITLVHNEGDSQTTLTTLNNEPVLQLNEYAYFQITDPQILKAQELTLTVTLYDNVLDCVFFEYCGEDSAYTLYFLEYGTEMFRSGEFVTLTIPLRDVDFDGKSQNLDSKLRFYSPYPENTLYIKSLTLSVGVDDDTTTKAVETVGETELNTLRGKGITGYQIWYRAYSEEIPLPWSHWTLPDKLTPESNHVHIETYPYTADYAANGATLYNSNLGKLGNGDNAMLFNSQDPEIIETHFQWLKEYDIDGVAIQRFYKAATDVSIDGGRTTMQRVMDNAEKYGRIFYVMYDFADTSHIDGEALTQTIKLDFIRNVENAGLTASPNYVHADGKPVVCLYALNRPGSTHFYGERTVELIQWFKDRGYYVIGGVSDDYFWELTGVELLPFTMLDMISTWSPYDFDAESIEEWFQTIGANDLAFCAQYNIDYQPVLHPGFCWTNNKDEGYVNEHPRNAGQFMWQQAYYWKTLGIDTCYFAMFDEMDEGTSIMKGASDYFEIPTDQFFVTWAADGWWLSNDFYLRTAGAIIDMMQGKTALRETINVPHSMGKMYWRNSFEKLDTTYILNGKTHTATVAVDVCLNNPKMLSSRKMRQPLTVITAGIAKTGNYSFLCRATGYGNNANLTYKLADTAIESTEALTLTYSIYAENNNSASAFIDLLCSDGTYLSQFVPTIDDGCKKIGEWCDVTVDLGNIVTEKRIIGVVIRWSGKAGTFTAYIDDIVIKATGNNT